MRKRQERRKKANKLIWISEENERDLSKLQRKRNAVANVYRVLRARVLTCVTVCVWEYTKLNETRKEKLLRFVWQNARIRELHYVWTFTWSRSKLKSERKWVKGKRQTRKERKLFSMCAIKRTGQRRAKMTKSNE